MLLVFVVKEDPVGEPRPVPVFWVWVASFAAVGMSLLLWQVYPDELFLFGGATVVNACLLSYWVRNRTKERFAARVRDSK
jgi:hypothetical protein